MYLKKIIINNIGPIDEFYTETKFNNEGNPIPIVVIGDNGKGKTALTSYITDALIELAKYNGAYNNIVDKDGAFYKIVSTNNIKNGKDYSFVDIKFENDNKYIEYYEKSGKITKSNIECIKNVLIKKNISDFGFLESDDKNYKKIVGTKVTTDEVRKIFYSDVLCFFPSYRSEKPSWYNENSIKYNEIYNENERINGQLDKEIIVEHSEERNNQWVNSIIVDSLVDIEKINDGWQIISNMNDYEYMTKARKNLEQILKLILKCPSLKLGIDYRNQNNRLNITGNNAENNKIIINNLNELSLGQAVLFNMFATIIRHGDINNIMNSIELSNITGIVIIDEIDMHLDSELQYDVLPKLLELFPKIQFIITTHSPLFLLGMDKEFGKNYTLLEMPNGNEITTERFSEFEKSYQYLNDTKKHEEEINNVISSKIDEIKNNNEKDNDIPIIITEGKTDKIHIKNALDVFQKKGIYKDLTLKFLDINEGESGLVKIKDALISLASIEKRLIILISDRDTDNNDIKKFECENGKFKKWTSNLYTFRLPVPEIRKYTPQICIEHYYEDSVIKKEFEIDGVKKRLFFVKEFDKETGDYLGDDNYKTNRIKWSNGIEIIDGSSKCKVTKFQDSTHNNYALSKMEFANRIIHENVNFDNFSFIFDEIEQIIKEYNSKI